MKNKMLDFMPELCSWEGATSKYSCAPQYLEVGVTEDTLKRANYVHPHYFKVGWGWARFHCGAIYLPRGTTYYSGRINLMPLVKRVEINSTSINIDLKEVVVAGIGRNREVNFEGINIDRGLLTLIGPGHRYRLAYITAVFASNCHHEWITAIEFRPIKSR